MWFLAFRKLFKSLTFKCSYYVNVSNANNLRFINAIDNAGKKPLLVG